jgi:hypothetical protein
LVEKVTRMQHGRRLTQAGRDLLDSIEVEEKAGLNFADVAAKPVATNLENSEELAGAEELDSENRKGSGSESPEGLSSAGDLADDIEEVTEVEEDKGEEVVEEIKEEEKKDGE